MLAGLVRAKTFRLGDNHWLEMMSMIAPATIAILMSGVLMTGFAANEFSQGDLAEGLGFGHHHMLDWGGYHCAEPGDEAWEQHEEHMHNGTHANEEHCGAPHMQDGWHHGHGGMMS